MNILPMHKSTTSVQAESSTTFRSLQEHLLTLTPEYSQVRKNLAGDFGVGLPPLQTKVVERELCHPRPLRSRVIVWSALCEEVENAA